MPSNAPPVVRLPVTKFRTKKSYKTLTGLLRSDERPEWVLVAHRSVRDWDLDFSTAQAELDAEYDDVTTAGKFTIYRRVDR